MVHVIDIKVVSIIKKILYLCLTLLLSFALASCMYDINGGNSNTNGNNNSGDYKPYSGYFSSMGTVINLSVYSQSQTEANNIYNGVKAIYDKYDAISDDGYDSFYGQSYDSELAKLNQNRSMIVSDELYNLLKFAVYMQDETEGYFNPFMGELNHEWKDYINMVGSMPSDVERNFYTTIARNTYLDFNDETNLVTIKNDLTENSALIDLGGVAKGYVTNLAYEYFKANNVKYYLLNAGSSNLLMGEKPDASLYEIALAYVYGYPNSEPTIEIKDGYWYIDGRNLDLVASEGASSSYGSTTPDSKSGKDGDLYFLFNDSVTAVYIKENGNWRNKLNLGIVNFATQNEAVVTSSPAEQHLEVNGTYYHHLVSPFTGLPVNNVDSVTVLGTDSGYLDALSTALFVMPEDVRDAYIEEHDLKVILTKNGQVVKETAGLEA